MKKLLSGLLMLVMLLINGMAAEASTANMQVYGQEPVISQQVSDKIIQLDQLTQSLAVKQDEIQKQQVKIERLETQLIQNRSELAQDMVANYKSSSELNLADEILNCKDFFDLLNVLYLWHYVVGHTYSKIEQTDNLYKNLTGQKQKLEAIQKGYAQNITQINQELQLMETNGILPKGPALNVPDAIKYQDISPYYDQIIAWLTPKNSLEVGKEYLQVLNAAGQRWNIDPLLLLAVTGQEQSFVPATDPEAGKIINNPFNVFHSWTEFQGGFAITALWAANTLARLSAGVPPDVNPIKWINGFDNTDARVNPEYGYADDPQWYIGVSNYYNQLCQLRSQLSQHP